MLFPRPKKEQDPKNMFRNVSRLGPEFVRTSQLVKENLVVTLSVGHPTLIKMNGFHFMEILDTNSTAFKRFGGSKKWREWA